MYSIFLVCLGKLTYCISPPLIVPCMGNNGFVVEREGGREEGMKGGMEGGREGEREGGNVGGTEREREREREIE